MKICLPVLAKDFDEVRALIKNYNKENKIDLYEIRLDSMVDIPSDKALKKEWSRLKKISEKPLILTYRTRSEGGLGYLDLSKYNNFILKAINNLEVDYLDIELFSCIEDAKAKMYISMCEKKGIKTILSRHELIFSKEARDVELLLMRMKYLGCTIPKLVVHAHTQEDSKKLWEGARKARANLDKIIAIASGEEGSWTRENSHELGIYINYIRPCGSKAPKDNPLGQIDLDKLNSF